MSIVFEQLRGLSFSKCKVHVPIGVECIEKLSNTHKTVKKWQKQQFDNLGMTLTFDVVTFVKVIGPQCHCKRPHGSRTFRSRVKANFTISETAISGYAP